MEEMRVIRNVVKEIEAYYKVPNSYSLAEELYRNGIYSINDSIKERISFLKDVCEDFSFDNYWIIRAIAGEQFDNIKMRYKKYSEITSSPKIKADSLVALSEEMLESYVGYFADLGMTKVQLESVQRSIIKYLGGVLKSYDDMKHATDTLALICEDRDELLQFITDNFEFIYNDFARKIDEVLHALIMDANGNKIDAFNRLKSNPEWLRWGIR